MASYTQKFKERMISRMLGPERISATALSREVGVPQPTLSRWVRGGRTVVGMNQKKNRQPKRTVSDKLRLLAESEGLSDAELGAFLRENGLHSADLERWRTVVSSALEDSGRKSRKLSPDQIRARELEKELARKDKALAEVTALLALKKKLAEIWGDEDESTHGRSGR